MQLEERHVGDVTVLAVNGEITLTKNGDMLLRDAIVALLQQGRRKLVLDLGGVTYMDSAGLGQLVQAQTKITGAGAAMKVAQPSARLVTLLKIAKLLPLFDICENERTALAALTGTAPDTSALGATGSSET
jgi:anti-sigma B factor antagonist